MTTIPHKTCSRCAQSKPLDLFKPIRKDSDKRHGSCRECMNAAEQQRVRLKYATDTEYRERMKKTSRERMAAKRVPHPRASVADRLEKRCPVCKVILLRAAYGANRRNPDGLHDTCTLCRRAARREKRQADPTWRANVQASQSRRYHERYKGGIAQQHAERYVADPLFREKEKGRARAAYRRRPLPYIKRARERQRNALLCGSFTQQEWESLCAFYGHRCLRCGEQKPLTRDHVIPLSKGGDNTIHNIQPLCEYCNKSKQDKTADYRTTVQSRMEWGD